MANYTLPNYTETTDSSGATVLYTKTPLVIKSLAIHTQYEDNNFVVSLNSLDYKPEVLGSWDDTYIYSTSFNTFEEAVDFIIN